MKIFLLSIVGSTFLATGPQISAQDLLATTNGGSLVEIDLAAGTAILVGDAGVFTGKTMGWAGLSFNSAGELFAVSNAQTIEPVTGCPQSPATPAVQCSHLYRLDPSLGTVLAEIGNTQAPFISDIDFALDGTLFGSQWDARGTLVTVEPNTALANPAGYFGGNLENGGLSVHPNTGEIWVVESNWAVHAHGRPPKIFRVDRNTGTAIPPIVTLGLLGTPTGFGFDALEILPDGRFVATRAGQGQSEIYEIDPIADAASGLAEVTPIPVVLGVGIEGSLNGLESLVRTLVVGIDVKPGSDPNCFNLDGNGVIPLAILGSDEFGVFNIDPASLLLDGLDVRVRGNRGPLCGYEDSDADGLTDLVCHFEDDPANWSGGSDTAVLNGELFDGTRIRGTDSICIVP